MATWWPPRTRSASPASATIRTSPREAVAYCLAEAGLTIDDVDYLVFYDKPLIKFERILMTYLATFPLSLPSFLKAIPIWLKEKLIIQKPIERELGFQGKLLFAEHHQSHAASAFLPSPFEEAAILTLDGVGEWATATEGHRPRRPVRAQPARSASRTRSACSTAPSPTTWASRSTPPSTR